MDRSPTMRILLLLAASAVALSACGQKTEKSAAAGGAPAVSGGGSSRNQVWAAGSSTVFPFATRVAENSPARPPAARRQGREPGHRRRHQAVLLRHGRRLPRHRQRLAADEEVRVRACASQRASPTSSRSRSASTASSSPPTRTAPTTTSSPSSSTSAWPQRSRPARRFVRQPRQDLGPRSARACRASASWSTARRRPRAPATPSSNWPWKPGRASSRRLDALSSDNEDDFKAKTDPLR